MRLLYTDLNLLENLLKSRYIKGEHVRQGESIQELRIF